MTKQHPKQVANELIYQCQMVTIERGSTYAKQDAHRICNLMLTTLERCNAPAEAVNYWIKVKKSIGVMDHNAMVPQDAKSGDIEFDTTEKDCVVIWQKQKDESNVIFIERSKVASVVEILKKELQG